MLNRIRRWFAGSANTAGLQSVRAWAQSRGLSFRETEEARGFCIEGRSGVQRWRMEYGRPERHYIERAELRLQADLQLPPALSLLLLSRPLIEELEVAAFKCFARTPESGIEPTLPEEMRWLALYPKVSLNGVHGMKQRFGMVGSAPEAGHRWLLGPLGDRLVQLAGAGSLMGQPLVLMVVRGRLCLRTAMDEPAAPGLDDTLNLFELAMHQADEVLACWSEDSDGTWLSTTSIAWQRGDLPFDLPLDPPSIPKL